MKRKFLRNSIIVVAIAAFLGVFYGLAYKNTPETDAAVKATDFNAGRIIDDEVFYNANTMTVDEIQAHLDKYSANCDMWGEKAIGYGRKINGVAVNPTISRREYARLMREAGRSDYHDAPYVCISKYYENPTTHATNYDTNGEAQEGMISAAQIIYNAAQEYSINPQVLLVMLKKESYVWGDTWPLKNEYNTVMGYGCPDNAACNAKYYGFYNQVMKAAWQLNYYKEHIYSYGYYPYMTNNIYYSPVTSCGTKAVYLENIATTSLYIYTPYTPNDAALANYPGEAYCGSYGNRNFFMYFNEWFGSGTNEISKKAIESRYSELGGQDGILGRETTDFICAIDKISDCVKGYENGAIIYSKETGAWENYGEIREKYLSLGSVGGWLGFPTSSIKHQNNDVVIQQYEYGVIIIDNNKTLAFEQNIYDYYISSFSERYALADSICGIRSKTDCVQQFNTGVLLYSEKTGVYENRGSIRNEYLRLGSVGGVLGFPTSNELCNNIICKQSFEKGAIYYDGNNIYSVYGEIYERYKNIGEHSSKISSPSGNIICNIDNPEDCVQAFDDGVIIYSERTGAWENYGAIRDRYLSLKSVGGKLGFPTNTIRQSAFVSSVVYQTFENGTIYYDEVSGAIWELYFNI